MNGVVNMIMGGSAGLTMELVKATAQSVFTSPVFFFLIGAMFLDFLTGVGKAFITGTYSSTIGIDGVVKHVMVLLLSLFLSFSFRLFGVAPVALTIKAIFAWNYLVSIVENLKCAGIHIPESITRFFLQMRDDAEDELTVLEDMNIIITKQTRDKVNQKKGVDR